MKERMIAAVGMMALTLAAGACNREATVEQREPAAQEVDRAAQLQKQRDEELSKIDERVAKLERDYDEYRASRPSGTSGTTVVRDEVKSDVPDVKKAVANLRTTTAENWWERHEAALKMAFDDVEADVRRFAGARTLPMPPKAPRVTDAAGEPVSTAPFTSSRDKFVADMRARVEAMGKALDGVKVSGPRKTSLDDMNARVDKLGEDLDRLASASAEDWWDLSKARVNDYIDRVEKSIARVDANKQ